MKGTVKWFNEKKGFGFITDETGEDCFVHFSYIQGEGFKTLKEGEVVLFSRVESDKGPHAEKVFRSDLKETEEEDETRNLTVDEFIAVGIFGNKLRLVSISKDGDCQFLDGFNNLHNIIYVSSSETVALQRAIEELEDLMNDPKSKELDFQNFFERNPDFILNDEYKKAHPHIVLTRDNGQTLIPDFVLEPMAEDELSDILELKLPSTPVYVMKKNRPRFFSAVAEACAQIREYSAFFDEEKNREAIHERYNLLSYKPKMFVVIGRKDKINPIKARRVHTDLPNMHLKTYDDIVCRMKYRVERMENNRKNKTN